MDFNFKILFFIFFLAPYLLDYLTPKYLAKNNGKAIQKILIFFLIGILFLSIIFDNTFINLKIESNYLLYVFILISFSINFIFLKKILEIEYKLYKLVQKVALEKAN